MGQSKSVFEYRHDKSRLYNTTSFYPLAALALAACGGGGGGGGSSPTPPGPSGGGANAPVLTVGGEQTLTLEEGTTNPAAATGFSFTATDEDDGDTVTLSVDDDRFEIIGGVLNVKANQTFDFETEPSITLTITATDDSATTETATQEVTITITNVPSAPVLIKSGEQATLNEGTFTTDTATGYTISATDEDGDDTVTFTFSDDRFNIVNNELVIVANSVFDFETESSITLTITASDGATTVTEEVTITITDAPEAPVLSVGGSQTLTLNEEETITAGTATGYTVSATDEDGDNVALSVDDARFTIADDGSLNIAADSEFDFETEPTITLTITATDDSTGLLTDTQTVTISITNVDFSTILSEVSLSGGSEPRSTPAFGDVDGDGDMDLLVGEADGVLNFYRWGTATDTAEAPGSGWTEQNAALTGNLAPLATDFGFLTGPAFADVDGDGDMDLLVGKATVTSGGSIGQDLTVDYLRWGGDDDDTAVTPATGWTAQTTPSPLNGDVISATRGFNIRATPAFGDVDGDGDMDLLIGSETGDLEFYRWGGDDDDTAATPASGWSEQNALLDTLGLTDILASKTTPAFGDVDGDGDMDLLVGAGTSVVFYRWGTAADTAASPGTSWGGREPTAGYPAGLDAIDGLGGNDPHLSRAGDKGDSAPVFGDVDGDGDMDLVFGQRDGGLDIFYWNDDNTWSQTSDII